MPVHPHKLVMTIGIIINVTETFFNDFANRFDPDQASLVRAA